MRLVPPIPAAARIVRPVQTTVQLRGGRPGRNPEIHLRKEVKVSPFRDFYLSDGNTYLVCFQAVTSLAANRRAGKAGHKPAAWPEDLGPYTVLYLKRQRSRLITGHILVRGQGGPPDLQSRIAIGMIAATIQRPAKQLRLRCGLGERPSGSLLEFQPLFSCNLLGGYALCTIPFISSGGGANNPLTVKLPKGGVAG